MLTLQAAFLEKLSRKFASQDFKTSKEKFCYLKKTRINICSGFKSSKSHFIEYSSEEVPNKFQIKSWSKTFLINSREIKMWLFSKFNSMIFSPNENLLQKREKVSIRQEEAFPGKIIWTLGKGETSQLDDRRKKKLHCAGKRYYSFFGCCKNARPLVISDQNASDLEVAARTKQTLSRRLGNRFCGYDEWRRGCPCPGSTPDPVQWWSTPQADHLQGQWDRWENNPAAQGKGTLFFNHIFQTWTD